MSRQLQVKSSLNYNERTHMPKERLEPTTWLLNNCQNLEHSKMYRHPMAMYDLYAEGRENNIAKEFREGDHCYVLSQESPDRIVIREYTFTRRLGPLNNGKGEMCHVLCGEFLKGEIVSRGYAIDHPVYRYFFNVQNHLCQWSAIRYDPK